MNTILAPLIEVSFRLEEVLNQQLGEKLFAGMDKTGADTCKFFMKGNCNKRNCPFRHSRAQQQRSTVVCKHWMRGLCKKGDVCEFLHEFDMTKMPECHFYSQYRECSNDDCQYLHIDPDAKVNDCSWYRRGFCKRGAECRHRHNKKVMCLNYLSGFCPNGPDCNLAHPKWEVIAKEDDEDEQPQQLQQLQQQGFGFKVPLPFSNEVKSDVMMHASRQPQFYHQQQYQPYQQQQQHNVPFHQGNRGRGRGQGRGGGFNHHQGQHQYNNFMNQNENSYQQQLFNNNNSNNNNFQQNQFNTNSNY